jgi:hypothetical protein
VRIIRRGQGFAAWGPGFYVWEEDAAELLGAAAALALAGRRGAVARDARPVSPNQEVPRR